MTIDQMTAAVLNTLGHNWLAIPLLFFAFYAVILVKRIASSIARIEKEMSDRLKGIFGGINRLGERVDSLGGALLEENGTLHEIEKNIKGLRPGQFSPASSHSPHRGLQCSPLIPVNCLARRLKTLAGFLFYCQRWADRSPKKMASPGRG
jgi:hypothetical protein